VAETDARSPPAGARRPRAADFWVDLAVRTVLLAILVVAGLSVLAVGNPRSQRPADLTADLRAGRVTSVSFNGDSGEIGWTIGLWHSYRTSALDDDAAADDPANTDDQANTEDSTGSDSSDSSISMTAQRAWLQRQIEASGQRLAIQDTQSSFSVWIGDVRWQRLRTLAGIAWGFTLLLMLLRQRRRVANRWGWWWMFVIGGAGAPLYLLLENEPLWRPRGGARRRPQRPPLNGGAGCGAALCLGAVFAVFGTLVTILR
jgi:hypothetical protein